MTIPCSNAWRFFIKILKGIYEENIVIGADNVNFVQVKENKIYKTIISNNTSIGNIFHTYDTVKVGNVQFSC